MSIDETLKKHRIYLVDDHPLMRTSLTNLINHQPDLAICGEAEDVLHARRDILAKRPDIIILDICLKDSSGLDLIKSLTAQVSHPAIVVLSMHDEKLYAERCLRAGARGYVTKRESPQRIVSAIREVLSGKISVSSQISSEFTTKFILGCQLEEGSLIRKLSDRELEVFRLLGSGSDTRKIAERLNVNIRTVQTYCTRIKQKLNLSRATELLRAAIRWNEQDPAG